MTHRCCLCRGCRTGSRDQRPGDRTQSARRGMSMAASEERAASEAGESTLASDGHRRTELDEEVVRRDGLECPSRRTTPPSRGEQSERTCLKHRYSHDVLSSGSGDLDAQAACGTGSVRAHRATRHGALVTGAQTSRAQTHATGPCNG